MALNKENRGTIKPFDFSLTFENRNKKANVRVMDV